MISARTPRVCRGKNRYPLFRIMLKPVVKSAVTSGSQGRGFDSPRMHIRSSVVERAIARKGGYSLACSPAPFFSQYSLTQEEAIMVTINRIVRAFTREGARAKRFTPEMELKRALMN